MEVGDKLSPQKFFRKGFALNGIQHIKTNNPSTIGPDELLTVRFQENQVIIPRTTKLTSIFLYQVQIQIKL